MSRAKRSGISAIVAGVVIVALPACHRATSSAAPTCAAQSQGPARVAVGGSDSVGVSATATIRGDAGLSGSFASAPVRQLRELWRSQPMAHPGRSYTAIGGLAILTDNAGLCAADVATGKLRWYRPGMDFTGNPTVGGGMVFVTGGPAPTITALDLLTGRVLWRQFVAKEESGAFAGLAVENAGTLFATRPDGISAFDVHSGHVRWRLSLNSPTAGLAVGEGRVFVVDASGMLHALNASDGRASWQTQVATSAELPLVADGIVLVGRGGLVALDALTGRIGWEESADQQVTGAALAGGTAYIETATSHLLAVDARNGNLRWDFVPTARAGFSTGPAVAGDVVYAGDTEGTVYAVDAVTHQQVGSYQADLRPGELAPGNRQPMTRRREFAGSPVVVADRVVVVSDVSGTVYALG